MLVSLMLHDLVLDFAALLGSGRVLADGSAVVARSDATPELDSELAKPLRILSYSKFLRHD
ncbi:hypothetical protein M758_4G034000 [Ceratodon purpureus]|nr:hypothetical protein M758_4G034000 [Ceratodon purpureus]